MSKRASVSLISHGQFALVKYVLNDLNEHCANSIAEVILTINVEETVSIPKEILAFPIHVHSNAIPQGFGANHNAAFKVSSGDYFCVLNPDIRLTVNPFPTLLKLAAQDGVGVVAPRILNANGECEDSARKFPTLVELLGKTVGRTSAVHTGDGPVLQPDWIAGMFMLFPRKVFEKIGGFDERYFLYYEDVDICARLALAGYSRLVCQDVTAVHDARRSSHTNPRYAAEHLRSLIRYFLSGVHRDVQKISR